MRVFLLATVCILLLGACTASKERTYYGHMGLAVDHEVSEQYIQCMMNHGHHFVLATALNSDGAANEAAAKTMLRANQAGIDTEGLGVVLNPCVRCEEEPGEQVEAGMKSLRDNNVTVGSIWVTILGGNWYDNCAQNEDWLRGMITKLEGDYSDLVLGIATNHNDWSKIMCGTKELGHMALWWSSGNERATMLDFQPFGGWYMPRMKLFSASRNSCGDTANLNFAIRMPGTQGEVRTQASL